MEKEWSCENCDKKIVLNPNVEEKIAIKWFKDWEKKQLEKYGKFLCRGCRQKIQYSQGLREKQREFNLKRNKSQKGKSREEVYGKETSDRMTKLQSEKIKGKNNGNHKSNGGKWHGGIMPSWNKGSSWKDMYGEEKANIMKKNLSKVISGEGNPMFGKPSPKKSGNGWQGTYKNHYFRSILELRYLKYLIKNNIKFESGELKKHKIPYELEGKKKNYFPDYYLIDTNEYVEIKPIKLINTIQNKAKYEACKNIKLLILTEKDLPEIILDEIKLDIENKDLIFNEKTQEKYNKWIIKK